MPRNVAPVLHVNGGVISWSADKGATTFHGAISTAAKNAAGRKTTYTVLGIVTSWKPATPACGTTLYYGVASEGNAGEQWTANEVSITGPKCLVQNVAPVLHVNGGVISWSADKGADTFNGAISTAARNAAGRTTTYTNLGLVTSWTPAMPACGTTVYYGVASEGHAGEQWTANEVAITGPTCPPPPIENVAPTLTYKIAPAGDREQALVWDQDPGATSYKLAICTAARGAPGRSCTYIDNIGLPGPAFGNGEPNDQMYWDVLSGPCGTHWFSIASEGPAGELWASAEYEFGPEFFFGLPACPPPEATGPPVGEQVFSINPEAECAAAINLINQDDQSSLPLGYRPIVPSPVFECETMGDLAGPSNDGVLGPVSTVNQDHLCEDWATVINEYTDFIRGWYVGSRGNCDVVTPAGWYIEAFNGAMASGNGLDAVPDYAQAALHNLYGYTLPWTTAVPAQTTTTIDFSTAPHGATFDPSFFEHEGIVFTQGSFVGFVQGDDALIGPPITADVPGGFTNLSAQVAAGFSGPATYTLAAYEHGSKVGSTSITVPQNTGDGYIAISVGPLPKTADSFSLSSVSSSYFEFGVASITWSK